MSTLPNLWAPWSGRATSRSVVSRRFAAAMKEAMAGLLEADLSGLDTAVVVIDGLNVAGEMIVGALIITADGTKVPVGLRRPPPPTQTVADRWRRIDRALRRPLASTTLCAGA